MRAVAAGDAMRAVVGGMKTTAAFLDDTAVVAVAVAVAPDRLLCVHSASPLGRLLRLRLLRLLLRLLLFLLLRLRLRLRLYLRLCLLPLFLSL